MTLPSPLELPARPLSAGQLDRLEQAAEGLSADALIWASGYLAGIARTNGTAAALPASVVAATPLAILYASQTGNGKRLAVQCQAFCAARGVPTVLRNLADYKPRQLAQEKAVLLVVSTHGDGDPPDDAIALHRHLAKSPTGAMAGVHFAVLALGDSSYPHFCKTGRDFDERLAALGAQRIAPRLDCDVDLGAASSSWMDEIAAAFGAHLPQATVPSATSLPGLTTTKRVAAPTAVATVLANQRITGRHSSKDVRHVEFAVDTAAFDFEPGDSISLVPRNPTAVVQEILALGGWQATQPVVIDGQSVPLGEALTMALEITQVARPVLEALAAAGTNEGLKTWLAASAPADVSAWLAERQIADVLRESSAAPEAQAFVDCLRPLAAREYSIASSRLATPDELHLTLGVVASELDGRARPGSASNYLAALSPGAEVTLKLVRNANFRLPANDAVPIIMVGPGTGIAPFRAFIEERAARQATGQHWLFFGERTQREDFLYQTEWQRHLREGTLARLDVAFSRDGASKVYVQDRLRAQAAEIHAWLKAGAHLYVCGDAKRMAKDVHAVLRDIFITQANLSSDEAEDALVSLRQQGRYQRDVY